MQAQNVSDKTTNFFFYLFTAVMGIGAVMAVIYLAYLIIFE